MHMYAHGPSDKKLFFAHARDHCHAGRGITPTQPLQCDEKDAAAELESPKLSTSSHLK